MESDETKMFCVRAQKECNWVYYSLTNSKAIEQLVNTDLLQLFMPISRTFTTREYG